MVDVSLRDVLNSADDWAAIPKISVGLQKVASAGHVLLGEPALLGLRVCAHGPGSKKLLSMTLMSTHSSM